jgi:hypothetical protein
MEAAGGKEARRLGRCKQSFYFFHKVVRAFLFRNHFVRTAIATQVKMPIHLHQNFLVSMPLLDFLTKFQARLGEVAHINNHQVIHWSGRNHGASGVQINGGINVVALHAQHESAQMLDRSITVNEQDARLTSGCSHEKCSQSTPA